MPTKKVRHLLEDGLLTFALIVLGAIVYFAFAVGGQSAVARYNSNFDKSFLEGEISIPANSIGIGSSGNPLQLQQTKLDSIPSGEDALLPVARSFTISGCVQYNWTKGTAVKAATMYSNPEEVEITATKDQVRICVPANRSIHIILWITQGQ